VIGQCLSNKNKSATVAKKTKILRTKQGPRMDQSMTQPGSVSLKGENCRGRGNENRRRRSPGDPCRLSFVWGFSSQNFSVFETVALSFLFDKHYPIME